MIIAERNVTHIMAMTTKLLITLRVIMVITKRKKLIAIMTKTITLLLS